MIKEDASSYTQYDQSRSSESWKELLQYKVPRVLIMQLFIVVSRQNCKDCSRLFCSAALTCSHLVIVGLGNSWYCDALGVSVSVMVMMSNSRHKVCCQHALFLNICDH